MSKQCAMADGAEVRRFCVYFSIVYCVCVCACEREQTWKAGLLKGMQGLFNNGGGSKCASKARLIYLPTGTTHHYF